MDVSAKNSPCKECEKVPDGVQLQAELEHLRQHLAERDGHIVALEGEFLKSTSRVTNLEEQVDTWREKYERLYDSHKRLQKLNQVLEDKLLQMVDKMKSEKSQLTKDIATLSVRLAESKHNYSMLQKENERYKNDMNLAIQLLQCKPDNFVSQKLDNLPVDTQARVSQYVMSKAVRASGSAHSKNGNEHDTFDASEYEFNISASLMTKILEDSIQDSVTKHCDTCTCSKSQNKPFCYNESSYSVATQTTVSGEMKSSSCLNCNSDIKSIPSNVSIRSVSSHAVKFVNENNPIPLYIIPQPAIISAVDTNKTNSDLFEKIKTNPVINDSVKLDENNKQDVNMLKDIAPKMGEDIMKHLRKNNSLSMEPAVHHKLCDRTKTSHSSQISSNHSVAHEDLLSKELPNSKELKLKNESNSVENDNMKKNSQSSMGALSRTSSIAKSTVSTHKSGTLVGPGPRFCHLRMQAGSKNILLDNAEPDVPPVLYRRQSKCNENSIFKDLNDSMDNFIDLGKNDDEIKEDVKNDNLVAESTLIDVRVDNNVKECNSAVKSASINPVLLNVSSSPLQPLKTHNFSNGSENNNNQILNAETQQVTSEIDNLLSDFKSDVGKDTQNNNPTTEVTNTNTEVLNSTDNEVKIFNFDRYEQNKLNNQYSRPLRKIDMSQLHSIENTRISKDLPPQEALPKTETKVDMVGLKPAPLPAIVNVYPNLTQTHLKVNEHKKVFTNEQSTSSLSSDDSAALLQKQQLLRVAEWVEQNLEQQNNYNDPLEDEVNFHRVLRRDSKLSRLTETLNELALNMPHPVSKYSKAYREAQLNWIHNASGNAAVSKDKADIPVTKVSNIVKETIFPVECGGATVTKVNNDGKSRSEANEYHAQGDLHEVFKANGDTEITAEDLARMEYNVKKFLLSGPQWSTPAAGRSRRTSSKTETDV